MIDARSNTSAVERTALWLFLLSIVLLPITKTPNLPVLQTRLTAFDFAAGLSILCWLWAARTSRWTLRLPASAHVPLALFVAAAVLSGWNAWRLLAGGPAFGQHVLEVLTFAYLAVYLLVGFNLFSDEHRLRLGVTAWVVGLAIVTGLGLLATAELLACDRPLSSLVLWNVRVVSTFRNPNQAAAYMLPSAVLIASLWANGRDVTRLGHLLFLLYIGAAAVLVATASRGGIIAGAVTLIALTLVWHLGRRALVLAGTAVLVTVVAGTLAFLLAARGNACTLYLSQTLPSVTIGLPDLRARVAERRAAAGDTPAVPDELPTGGDTGTAVGLRRMMLTYAWALAHEHPFIGVGAGTMPYHVLERTHGRAFVATHNTPLTILAEMGWLGLVAFGWLFGAISWAIFRKGIAVSGPLRGVCLGLVLAIFSIGVMGLSFDAQRQRAMWLASALGLASARLIAGPQRDGREQEGQATQTCAESQAR